MKIANLPNSLALLFIGVPLGLVGAFLIGSCNMTTQSRAGQEEVRPVARSGAYEEGYAAGYACCRARQNAMSAGVLANVAKMRFPSNPDDFVSGYRSGYMAAP